MGAFVEPEVATASEELDALSAEHAARHTKAKQGTIRINMSEKPREA